MAIRVRGKWVRLRRSSYAYPFIVADRCFVDLDAEGLVGGGGHLRSDAFNRFRDGFVALSEIAETSNYVGARRGFEARSKVH